MQLNSGHIAFSVACMVAGIIIGASFRSCSHKGQPEGQTLRIHDTITLRDTCYLAGKTKEKEVVKWDTCYLPAVSDTLDSVAVEVPISAYEYRDTFKTDSSEIRLGVAFQGYKAKIDSIDLSYRFDVKPRVVEKKSGFCQFVGIGIGVGYGASVVGHNVYAAPEVGVHVVYGFGYTLRK